MRFAQKSTISKDQSAILLWASDERPPVVARITCENIHEITDVPECQKWADASPNIEILIEIACRLFAEGRYINEQSIRVVEISGTDLIRERNRFRRAPNLRPGFMDRTILNGKDPSRNRKPMSFRMEPLYSPPRKRLINSAMLNTCYARIAERLSSSKPGR